MVNKKQQGITGISIQIQVPANALLFVPFFPSVFQQKQGSISTYFPSLACQHQGMCSLQYMHQTPILLVLFFVDRIENVCFPACFNEFPTFCYFFFIFSLFFSWNLKNEVFVFFLHQLAPSASYQSHNLEKHFVLKKTKNQEAT